MADYILGSICDLLTSDLESISDFVSSQGSYHPLCEGFMVDIIDSAHRDGHIKSTNDGDLGGDETPRAQPSNGHGSEVDAKVPPHL
jgi:hypothetical protein